MSYAVLGWFVGSTHVGIILTSRLCRLAKSTSRAFPAITTSAAAAAISTF
jgi:hypothetical protein